MSGSENKKLVSKVDVDNITKQISYDFDIDFDGISTFEPLIKYEHGTEFNIGLIVGSSGGGKSTLLREYGTEIPYDWYNTKTIASNFSTYENAQSAFMGVGLNTVPVWLKPFNVLSNGERYRADMAIRIKDGAVFDEFTSIVDRPTAKSMSNALGKYIRKMDYKGIVLASPHKDIIEYLQPDWVYDVDTKEITLKDSLRKRPDIEIKFKRGEKHLWDLFSKHHYISSELNKASDVYTAYWEGVLVGFDSVLPMPSGTLKNAFREHRLVVFPEYQGFGFGKAITNAIGQYYKNEGKLFYSKTAHPKLGMYREKSPLWEGTSKNRVQRSESESRQKNFTDWKVITDKLAYSHKYIGDIKVTNIDTKIMEELDEW